MTNLKKKNFEFRSKIMEMEDQLKKDKRKEREESKKRGVPEEENKEGIQQI